MHVKLLKNNELFEKIFTNIGFFGLGFIFAMVLFAILETHSRFKCIEGVVWERKGSRDFLVKTENICKVIRQEQDEQG